MFKNFIWYHRKLNIAHVCFDKFKFYLNKGITDIR